MPGSQHGPSIKNPRVYDALRRRGYSKRRAAAISNAQRHKDSGTANLAIPPHGPDALFNQPAMAQRRRRKRYKAFNWGAHVGQAISGRLTRGAGGRFSGDGQASAAKPPGKSHERRTATRAARQQRMEALRAARAAEQEQEAAKRAEEDAYIAAGKTGRERQQRRAEIAAARRERAATRKVAHQKQIADERAKRDEEDAAPADEEGADAEPKKGGGGGGGKKKPSDEEKAAEQERKKAANRATTAPKAGLSTAEAEFLAGIASGTAPAGSFDGRHLAELGLTQDAGDTTEATDAGRRALAALERGDVRGALAAIQDGKAKVARDRAKAEQRRQREEQKRGRDAERRKKRASRLPAGPVRQTTKADSAGSSSLSRFRYPSQAIAPAADTFTASRGHLPARFGDAFDASIAPSFAVFKDARGIDRWLCVTTTAYEDRDAEIITTKGIAHAVAYGDRTGNRGVLRYWHVKGFDLGPCDFQATAANGRALIESGTFYGPSEARLGRAMAARGWQMSPGFVHTRGEPYVAVIKGRRLGLYDHPIIFERSPTPPGRASNLFGWFAMTKETRMDDEKRAKLKELAGDDEQLLTDLLTRVEQTDKAAQEQAVYKDAPPWAQALVTRLDGLEERLKAFPPAAAVDEEAAATDDLAALETETAAMDEPAGMDDEGFADLVSDRSVEKLLAKIGPMFDLMKTMLAMLQPIAQKDDARGKETGALKLSDEELAKKAVEFDARLKELEGSQPRAHTSLASGVWGQLSGTPVTKEQAAQLAAKPAGEIPAGISDPIEADAYRLIFGE